MLDIDGTLIPYDYYALPSEKVKNAVKSAQEKLTVCLVTGRAYKYAEIILDALGMKTGYVVVNNGANVVDISTKKLLYDQPLDIDDARKIIEIFHAEGLDFHVKQSYDRKVLLRPFFEKGEELKKAYMILSAEAYTAEKIDGIMTKLSSFSKINAHKSGHADPKKGGVTVSHINATKTHGIQVIQETLGIEKDETIGIGDGYNDFPLLMACGLKVAMGNAVPQLKEIADYIAPTVDEDGVVDVINKFVLKNETIKIYEEV